MASEIKLTQKIIKQIKEKVKLHETWGQIALAIGVTDRTIRNWRNTGSANREAYTKGQRTLPHQLVDVIDAAKTELYEAYAEVVRNDALNERVTTSQIVKREADGSETVVTTKKTEPPNSALALKVLERMHPANWAEVKRIEVDWRDQVSKQGGNPDEIKARVCALIDGASDDPEDDTDT